MSYPDISGAQDRLTRERLVEVLREVDLEYPLHRVLHPLYVTTREEDSVDPTRIYRVSLATFLLSTERSPAFLLCARVIL